MKKLAILIMAVTFIAACIHITPHKHESPSLLEQTISISQEIPGYGWLGVETYVPDQNMHIVFLTELDKWWILGVFKFEEKKGEYALGQYFRLLSDGYLEKGFLVPIWEKRER